MTSLRETLQKGKLVENARPRLRRVVDESIWLDTARQIAEGQGTLLSLWGDTACVHMAIAFDEPIEIHVISLDCPDGHFPSVARIHPPALRLERAIRDLYGIAAEDSPDERPWLDHGRFGLKYPCGSPQAAEAIGTPYGFLPAEGEPLHQIPVGPVHAGIIEPGHFRFSANGEIIVRLEERLGYVHKGIDRLMMEAPLDRAARLAGRVSGDSTIAYAWAFSAAIEAALEIEVPRRALYLRALMAEIERLANHLGDIGAICNDASFALLHAHCGILRERVLRAADLSFGHRLMMDRIVPGGVTHDLTATGLTMLEALLREIRTYFPRLIEVYDLTASLQDRTVRTGILSADLAHQHGCGGFIGRASGRGFDARRAAAYAPYSELTFEIPTRAEGDVDARIWIRIKEVEQSLALIDQILAKVPEGPLQAEIGAAARAPCEGLALIEGFRGDILAWVRLAAADKIERCHLRDPSWFQWPLLEAAIEGNIVADFPLCNKSFNCSYSGHDL
ncbi:MAG: NADH-quinone oxidoreductase subunit C [Methylovirgula sp.]